MSTLVARILLSLMVVPLGALVYIVSFIVINTFYRDDEWSLILAGGATWGFVAAYWVLLWRRAVSWTTARVTWTLVGAALALVLGLAIGAGLMGVVAAQRSFVSWEWAPVLAFATACSPVLWLFATVLVWRETRDERAARVRGVNRGGVVCPTCGYNLTGLSDARCPECGARYTLDELLASQPQHAAATDLEQ
jgi:hypothetical protein